MNHPTPTGAQLANQAADALRALAYHQFTNPDDFATTLNRLHGTDSHTVIAALLTLLDRFASTAATHFEQTPLIADYLQAAGEHISGAAADFIDRAREATGHWFDTEGSVAR